jgi:cell filamentation protein
MASQKYKTSRDESDGEILPNKLGLKTKVELEKAELEGFLYAYKVLFDDLSAKTKFNMRYILKIHKFALNHLYSFAGKTRTVNLSKGGFMFPPALALDNALKEFNDTVLTNLPKTYESEEQLIRDIARVHAELLFIHPFREGNGRTARLLANLMAAKAGHKLLELENFSKEKFDEYVKAVKLAANRDYSLMEKIIHSLF